MPYNYLSATRRKAFVSYHHRNDQFHYDEFSRVFHDGDELTTDNSPERIDSADVNYVMHRIREHHLSGSSRTIALCGAETSGRRYVDGEIMASLHQQMGIVGVGLPTVSSYPNGGTAKQPRLQDNIDSGYALWMNWPTLVAKAASFGASIEKALASPGG